MGNHFNPIFLHIGGLAGIAGLAAGRKVSPLAPGAKAPAKGSLAGVASKLGGAASKKKGGSLASRLSKMGQGSSFGPSSTIGVRFCFMFIVFFLV